MNRRLFLLVIALLACLALPAGFVAAEGEVTAAGDAPTAEIDWTWVESIEPNDTPAQALQMGYQYSTGGNVNNADTVDYFRFTGAAGDLVALAPGDNGWDPEVALILTGPTGVVVPLSGPNHYATLPVAGVYHFRFELTTPFQYDFINAYYHVYLARLGADEPNDTRETAIPVQPLQTVRGMTDYPCDNDWYTFQGRAGDAFQFVWPDHSYWDAPRYYLYDAEGQPMQGVNILPADGVYYIQYFGWWADDDEGGCNEGGTYDFVAGYPMWVSADVDNLGGNTGIKQQDIAMRANQPGKWQLVFDASDVGITQDLVAMERLDDGSILMSLGASQTVPGLGKVMPQDIIRFIPTSLGANTAGSFEWYLDGSDVGLTTTGEKIDAISRIKDSSDPNQLVISISGAGSVPRQSGGALTVQDEDLINFVGTAYGVNSAGKWRMNLDGSAVPGMAAEDTNAATLWLYGRFARLMLSFTDSFTVNGVSGGPRDVFGAEDRFPASLVVKNLTNVKLDALTVGVVPGSEPRTTTLAPTNDATASSAQPDAVINVPRLNIKNAGEDFMSYLKFNVSGLTGTIQSAKVRLYVVDDGWDSAAFAVSPFYRDTTTLWKETGLTWNNAPAIPWGSPLGVVEPTPLNQWIEFDATQAVRAALADSGLLSLALGCGSANVIAFSSKEGANPPQLVVVTAP